MTNLGTRVFEVADQAMFAAFSGDANPMHMDAVAARRTQAGAPVVHGMHTLLWCLEMLARARPGMAVASLKMRADRMIYLGDRVEAVLRQETATGVRAEVLVEGAVACRVALGFGAVGVAETVVVGDLHAPAAAREVAFATMAGMRGRVGFAVAADEAARLFPAAAGMLGARRVVGLGCLTRLVGMVCPGLHSIFGGVDLRLVEDRGGDEVGFAVVKLAVGGAGLQGGIDSFARMPPVAQPGMAEVAGLVAPGAFAGSVVLVVGGSRGLGEVTAKIAAAGGAKVVVTYAAGQADGARVAGEIGGTAIAYDALRPAAGQLGGLAPTHVYYFATPHIGRRKQPVFDAGRLDLFMRFYVTGFYDLCRALPGSAAMFYPSSVFVAERPAELTEYAMAKAAGEELCRDLGRAMAPLRVVARRLPRLDTDQNSSVTAMATERGLDVMLPIVREVQG